MNPATRCVAPVLLLLGAEAGAVPSFSDLFVFGDSLSDTGNAFLATGTTTQASDVTDNTFIPSFPYDRGPTLLPAFSNGPIWVELLATDLGVTLGPSFIGGNNFALGGSDLSPLSTPSVVDRVLEFTGGLDAAGVGANPDALYVVWGGGNDARRAAADPPAAIGNYVDGLSLSISELAARGAQHFLVPNVPDIGLSPALQSDPVLSALGTALAEAFNDAYDLAVAGLELALDIEIVQLDVQSLLREIVADPGAFGLLDASNACAANAACRSDPRALFWDAIHPTAAGHAILAERAMAALSVSAPAPASVGLVLMIALGLALGGRQAMRRGVRVRAGGWET